jgi:hypothetical protein
MTFMTVANLIFNLSATALIFAQISLEITSSHVIFETATILSRMYLMISLAFVNPLATASRMN